MSRIFIKYKIKNLEIDFYLDNNKWYKYTHTKKLKRKGILKLLTSIVSHANVILLQFFFLCRKLKLWGVLDSNRLLY